jgi:hypothetical protein
MKEIKLNLRDEKGTVKHYIETEVPGKKLLEYLEMLEGFEAGEFTAVQILERKLEFVASIFNDKDVTAESVLTGLNSYDVIPEVERIIREVIGAEDDPKQSSEA